MNWRALPLILSLMAAPIWAGDAKKKPAPAAAPEPPAQRVKEALITAKDREHWAFRPLARPALPKIAQRGQVKNEIDYFILEKLEAKGLRLMPAATPSTQIRRVTFDLTGLPPTPEATRAFRENPTDEAYAQYVDSLLASPSYGERWAQHWLDLARYAETDGFEHDLTRPDAWRYRDWVIEALNRDIPLDQFVSLQLAGDEIAPGDEWSALATGFLVSGPDMPDINSQEERRHTVLNEMTSTVGAAFMGMTLACAQCHDHPYDPISHADFYRLRAFFENAVNPQGGKQLGYQIAENGPRPPRTFVMMRGDYRQPGPEIGPWFPRIVNAANVEVPSILETMTEKSTGRRKAFAAWLTRADNQLFLRSLANRLWQHHFVTPIAGTPNDLGHQGPLPTHPALLDWLATEIPQRQWSLKAMHRLFVTSAAYRQSSFPVNEDQWAAAVATDPTNALYSRMNRTRLSGEGVRDSMLAVSGRLNPTPFGPGVHLPLPKEVEITLLDKHRKVSSNPTEYDRRSVYVFARRNLRYPLFDVFDRPDGLTSCAMRTKSTTAPQSLTMLNSPFARDMAETVAESVLGTAGHDPAEWINAAAWKIFSRPPTENEYWAGKSWLQSQVLMRDERAVLADYCLALLNTNAFLYVD